LWPDSPYDRHLLDAAGTPYGRRMEMFIHAQFIPLAIEKKRKYRANQGKPGCPYKNKSISEITVAIKILRDYP
jgi:hypothetical protein